MLDMTLCVMQYILLRCRLKAIYLVGLWDTLNQYKSVSHLEIATGDNDSEF